MGRGSVALLAVLVGAGVACRHVAPSAALSEEWPTLATVAPPFVALYRLSCCGQRELLATVRDGEDKLAITVVAPPGATVVEAWIVGAEGWVAGSGGRCRSALPPGSLPLPEGRSLPLDARIVALVLTGRVPTGSRPARESGPWLEGAGETWWWRAVVVGQPPRCERFMLGRAGEGVAAEIELGNHRGSLPGRLHIVAGGEVVDLTLVEWRASAVPGQPGWMTAPQCSGGA